MKYSALLSGIAFLVVHSVAALAAPAHGHKLPACSEKDIGNCTCPNGTEYQAAKTYAVIGVNALDFQKLYGSCALSPFLQLHIRLLVRYF